MSRLLNIFLVCYSCAASAQAITTFAGNGTNGYSGDNGPATLAAIGEPFGCIFDTSNYLYFSDVQNSVIRKIAPNGYITTVAGTGSSGYNGDNISATAAKLNWPEGIAFDSIGNMYIADALNNRVRKVNTITGVISTFAGNGTSGYGGDGGQATASILSNPNSICSDKYGNLFVTDAGNFRIRKIDKTGKITTFAGNGSPGYTGDNNIATDASIENLRGICADDAGNIYFTQGVDNRVRKINTSGIITTIAGNGMAGDSGDGQPATAAGLNPFGLVCDKTGKLYISSYISNVVREIDHSGIIHTVAGNGAGGYSGDGGPAISASLYTPIGIGLDTCGNLYIADRDDNHIRKVSFNPPCWRLMVQNDDNDNLINVYPNPTDGVLKIYNTKTQITYHLIDLTGSVIQRGTLDQGNNTISIQSLPAGIYLLEIIGDEGNQTIKKIIKG